MYRRCSESRNEILVREDSTINGYNRTYYHTLDSSAYETVTDCESLSCCVDAADCVRVFPGEEISACDGGGGGVCWHEILSSSSRHALVEVSTSNTRSAVRVIFLCVNQNSGHSFSCTHKLLRDHR